MQDNSHQRQYCSISLDYLWGHKNIINGKILKYIPHYTIANQSSQIQGDNNPMNSNPSSASSSNRNSCTEQNSSSQNIPEPQPETIEQRFNKILIQADLLIAQQQYPQAVTKLNLLSEKINRPVSQAKSKGL